MLFLYHFTNIKYLPLPSTIKIKNKIEPYQLIKVAPFKKEVRRTEPHKHKQYFEIVYLSAGSGNHWIDGEKYPVKAPVLFFISNGQVHNWDLHSLPDGHVLIIKHAFIEHSEDGQIRQLLQRLWSVNCAYFSADSQGEVERLFRLLENQPLPANDLEKMTIEGLMKALICKILILIQSSVNHLHQGTSLYLQYLDLLDKQSIIQRKVSYYATKLGTTPQNLNAVCRKAADQSAGEMIAAHILDEARRLLLYTHNTVSQIAYQLEFSDPSYFVKYFKKHLHITPDAFRKRAFSK